MELDSIVIARLKRELAQTEAHAELLRARLASLGVTNPGCSPQQAPNGEKLKPGPITKRDTPPETVADLGYQGLYFKIGRKAFVSHKEATSYLAASRFADAEGQELTVHIKRCLPDGRNELLCVVTATWFASEAVNAHSESTLIKALDFVRQESAESQQIISEQEIQSLSDPEEIRLRV
jgi:hypothetical protein